MTERFTVSLDKDLAEAFEIYREKVGYESRSEAVRDLLRGFLARERAVSEPGGNCVGVLTYVYDHHNGDLGKQLTQVQHDHHDLTVATLHVHLDHDFCLEASVLRGSLTRVREFSNQLVSRRGVRHGELHLVPVRVEDDKHSHGRHSHTHEHITPHD